MVGVGKGSSYCWRTWSRKPFTTYP